MACFNAILFIFSPDHLMQSRMPKYRPEQYNGKERNDRMSIILTIEPQPRKKNQYILTLDDGRTFFVHEEVIVKHGLHSKMEIDEARLKSWIWEANVKIASDMALHYLEYRTRTKKQLHDYLKRKGFEEPVVEEAARKMEKYRFLDDKEYARRWVQSKKTGKPTGRRKIAYELRGKGISQDILESALTALTVEEEQQQAVKLAEKLALKHKALPSRERMAKISQALMRRGFDWETTSWALRQLSHDEMEE